MCDGKGLHIRCDEDVPDTVCGRDSVNGSPTETDACGSGRASSQRDAKLSLAAAFVVALILIARGRVP
jgi:hypothetical protein